jgi:hypothetical protein
MVDFDGVVGKKGKSVRTRPHRARPSATNLKF